MPEAIDFSALIISRVCHDLISPIGAIGNGIELLSMDERNRAPEHELINEAVAQATARLRLFRLAFGSNRSDLRLAGSELTSLLATLTRGGRLRLTCRCDSDLAREEVKLVLLLLLCLEHALPWGGEISFEQSNASWQVKASARRMRLPARLWKHLNGAAGPSLSTPPPLDSSSKDDAPLSQIDPNEIQFDLMSHQLHKLGRTISGKLQQTHIELSF